MRGIAMNNQLSNKALHLTKALPSLASFAGERRCCADASWAMNTFGGDHPNAVSR